MQRYAANIGIADYIWWTMKLLLTENTKPYRVIHKLVYVVQETETLAWEINYDNRTNDIYTFSRHIL